MAKGAMNKKHGILKKVVCGAILGSLGLCVGIRDMMAEPEGEQVLDQIENKNQLKHILGAVPCGTNMGCRNMSVVTQNTVYVDLGSKDMKLGATYGGGICDFGNTLHVHRVGRYAFSLPESGDNYVEFIKKIKDAESISDSDYSICASVVIPNDGMVGRNSLLQCGICNYITICKDGGAIYKRGSDIFELNEHQYKCFQDVLKLNCIIRAFFIFKSYCDSVKAKIGVNALEINNSEILLTCSDAIQGEELEYLSAALQYVFAAKGDISKVISMLRGEVAPTVSCKVIPQSLAALLAVTAGKPAGSFITVVYGHKGFSICGARRDENGKCTIYPDQYVVGYGGEDIDRLLMEKVKEDIISGAAAERSLLEKVRKDICSDDAISKALRKKINGVIPANSGEEIGSVKEPKTNVYRSMLQSIDGVKLVDDVIDKLPLDSGNITLCKKVCKCNEGDTELTDAERKDYEVLIARVRRDSYTELLSRIAINDIYSHLLAGLNTPLFKAYEDVFKSDCPDTGLKRMLSKCVEDVKKNLSSNNVKVGHINCGNLDWGDERVEVVVEVTKDELLKRMNAANIVQALSLSVKQYKSLNNELCENPRVMFVGLNDLVKELLKKELGESCELQHYKSDAALRGVSYIGSCYKVEPTHVNSSAGLRSGNDNVIKVLEELNKLKALKNLEKFLKKHEANRRCSIIQLGK